MLIKDHLARELEQRRERAEKPTRQMDHTEPPSPKYATRRDARLRDLERDMFWQRVFDVVMLVAVAVSMGAYFWSQAQ